jgi:Lrp/AsnC family leucine-responsive transcriptional regulator
MIIDHIDRHIVMLLQADGKLSFQDLGDAVGLSAAAAFQRVRRLEERGVITGYHAQVAPSSVGRGLLAFVRLRTGPTTAVHRLIEEWRASTDVLECHRMSGRDGYLLKLRVGRWEVLTGFLDAARAAGCTASVDLSLSTEFERWSLTPVD